MGIEKDGYLPPRDVVFDEIIGKCNSTWIRLFDGSADTDEYIRDKLAFNDHLKNEGADVMFALARFHPILRHEVIRNFSAEAKDFINYYEQVNENQRSDSENDFRQNW
jgi:hypothetical protein